MATAKVTGACRRLEGESAESRCGVAKLPSLLEKIVRKTWRFHRTGLRLSSCGLLYSDVSVCYLSSFGLCKTYPLSTAYLLVNLACL